jgi:hypothetical protein
LIESFEAENEATRTFLDSIKKNVVYVIPVLIETFAEKYRYDNPKKLRDLMTNRSYIGSLFVLVNDSSDWTYVGVSVNGKPMARPINSDMICELDEDEEIKWVF